MKKENIGKWLLATLGILVLCLLAWNATALNQIQQEQERLWLEVYGVGPREYSVNGIRGDLEYINLHLWDMPSQLDNMQSRLNNIENDLRNIEMLLR